MQGAIAEMAEVPETQEQFFGRAHECARAAALQECSSAATAMRPPWMAEGRAMQGAIAEMAEVPKTQEQLSAGRMDAHERPPYRDVVTPRVTRDKYGEIAAIRDFSASAY